MRDIIITAASYFVDNITIAGLNYYNLVVYHLLVGFDFPVS